VDAYEYMARNMGLQRSILVTDRSVDKNGKSLEPPRPYEVPKVFIDPKAVSAIDAMWAKNRGSLKRK